MGFFGVFFIIVGVGVGFILGAPPLPGVGEDVVGEEVLSEDVVGEEVVGGEVVGEDVVGEDVVGEEVGGGVSPAMLTRPPVTTLPESEVVGVAPARMPALISVAVIAGYSALNSAATPVTCGVAIDVP